MKQEPHRISALEAKCRLAEQALEEVIGTFEISTVVLHPHMTMMADHQARAALTALREAKPVTKREEK